MMATLIVGAAVAGLVVVAVRKLAAQEVHVIACTDRTRQHISGRNFFCG